LERSSVNGIIFDMKNFWNELPKPFFVLAPMEDVTDVVFRTVVAKAGRPDVFMSEFTNASSFCSEGKGEISTRGRLKFLKEEQPMVAQIWGKNPDEFEKMAIGLAERGFAGVDINTGCPDKKVVKSGGGSALIENSDLAVELIKATKKSGLPVSVKTRLGVRSADEWRSWLPILLKQDIVNLTVHLRTRKEMSVPPAHHELIPEIITLRDEIAPQTKLTINGDIRDRVHGLELANQHPGIDGLMIGRGIFTNPFAFNNSPQNHNTDDLFTLLRFHLDQFDKFRVISPDLPHDDLRNLRKFDPLKRFLKIYVKGFPGAAELRARLFECKTTNEIREILNGN